MSAAESASPIWKHSCRKSFCVPGSPSMLGWLNFVRPKKLPGSDCVNCDRDGEKRDFGDGDFCLSVARQQKKHPGKEDHSVPIGELPTPRVSVAPKDERQEGDRHPRGHLISSA